MKRRFTAIQMFYELRDSAAVIKVFGPDVLAAFVRKGDLQTSVEERHLPEPLGQRVKIELRGIHDRGICLKSDLGASLIRFAGFRKRRFRNPALVVLFPGRLIAPDFYMQALCKRIYAAYAHSVETA